MKKILLLLFLLFLLVSCSTVESNNDNVTNEEKTEIIEEIPTNEEIVEETPLAYTINEANFETRKINSIDEITMDDFFNLGNRIDIRVSISNE